MSAMRTVSLPPRSKKPRKLRPNLLDDSAFDVGQPQVATAVLEGPLPMVNAEQMEHGGAQLVDVDDVIGGDIAQLIGCAAGRPALDAAGHEHRETFPMMIAARDFVSLLGVLFGQQNLHGSIFPFGSEKDRHQIHDEIV
jgi:hypothetical protein